jgi:FG-GAP repeat protein
VPRNRRAVISTTLFAITVALTGSLVLFLSSAAQAAGRRAPASPAVKVGKAGKAGKHGQTKNPVPLSTLLATDAWPDANFGWSVSVSGTTAVVGAPYGATGAGEAYVFAKTGGTWSQKAILTASDGVAGDEFGWSVNISGTTIVVGAPGHYFGIGAAYIFSDAGGSWTQVAELNDSDSSGNGDTKFGYSVVTSGAAVMVGADGYGGGMGAVYAYSDVGGTWTGPQRLTASDGTAPDEFGWSMALSGTTLVVSAVRHAANGAIYVFTQSGGNWSQQAELTAADGFADDYFGDKVAISGGLIVAGAPGHHDEQGAAYVFTGSGAKWTQTGEVTASDGQHNDCFGWAVGLSGTTVVVGAEQTNDQNGAAYEFKKSGSKWVQKKELSSSDGGGGNEFGYSASLSGTTAVISAQDADAGAGTVYVYKL